jgi:formamidopyrimidine-DNA glycosylase
MPELPEVETIVRSLRNPVSQPLIKGQGMNERPGVVGRTITTVEVFWQKSVAEPSVNEFKKRIKKQKIRTVSRRGKFILLGLDSDSLLIHLRMSGDLRVEYMDSPIQTHDRILLNFIDGTRLVFNDTRKFGRVWLVKDMNSVLGDLGPEPFNELLNGNGLYQRLHFSSRKIKTLLLDQTVIAGIGNIYSDEALHRARIHPETVANQISVEQAEVLLVAIRETLAEGIRRNGASIDWVYRGGEFQNHFRVYQRTGEPCPACGTKIERKLIGQRSSHFCPVCQPLRSCRDEQ